MRNQKEMMSIIFETAYKDENIRVVTMNGSRVNSNIEEDEYQDYDIVYIVKDAMALIESRQWIDAFGERLIMQTPMDSNPKGQRWFTYLMQFKDGNRIDLMIVPLKDLSDYLKEDKLTKVLIDKDGFIDEIDPPSDQDYWVKRPSLQAFQSNINQFLWVSLYVVKGLKRNQVIYAINHLNIIRDEMLKMMAWHIGIKHDFKVNLGKDYKFLEAYVSTKFFVRLMKTYNLSTVDLVWENLERIILMYEVLCDRVSDELGYAYNRGEFHAVKQAVLSKCIHEI